MSRQNSQEVSAGVFLVYCPIILLFVSQTSAFPLDPMALKPVPWAEPCSPHLHYNSMVSPREDTSLEYLLDKAQESYYHAEYIEGLIQSQINDPQIIEYLRNKNLKGFPKPAESGSHEKVNHTKMLIEHYGQLSKVSVFLEYMYQQDIERVIKIELEDLLFCNLSQMCEIQMTIANKDQPQEFPVADRSIIPTQDQPPRSAFRRFENAMILILKYIELLDFHISQYKKERGF